MPRQAIDYSKTVIYKIVCRDLTITECYVGSTTGFRKRKNAHKSKCHNDKDNLKLYQFINSNGGWDNWDMIEIEKYECNDGNEQRARERYWTEELKAELNMRNSFITNDEHKNYQKTYQKDYAKDNKEKLKAYQKTYQKDYAKDNKEKLKAYQKKYREEHK